jgi:mRNA interferase RelE/StbE
MPAKQLLIPERTRKTIGKLPKNIQRHIPLVLLKIRENPLSGRKLHGELSGYYKYRLGDYRIVYSFASKISTVVVVAVEHRQGVYK